MPTIDELRETYFVQPADVVSPDDFLPATFPDCKVTPIIDGAAYNAALEGALATVGTGPNESSNAEHFIFIANWWLGLSGGSYQSAAESPSGMGPQVVDGSKYPLDPWTAPDAIPFLTPPLATKFLLDILKEKARAGVDVRVLGWVSFAVMDSSIAQKSGAGHIARTNGLTMESIKDLRAEQKIAKKAVLNVIAHTAGAAHNKFVVIGNSSDAIGFTGGLDFEFGRWARPGHMGLERWHDVMAMVEGPAVQAFYDHFKRMWNENISRKVRRFKYEGAEMPSFVPETPVIPARELSSTPRGKHHVQSMRTVPRFNYSWANCLPENQPIEFAPNGIFEHRTAWKKALQAAEKYVYMEDQSYWSQEILSWVNAAIRNRPALRVILLFPGAGDPNDPGFEEGALLTQSINHGLLEGLTATQRDQVRLFKRMGDFVPLVSAGQLVGVSVTTVVDEGSTSKITLGTAAQEDVPADAIAGKRFQLVLPTDTSQRFDVVGNDAVPKGGNLVWRVRNRPGPIPPATGDYVVFRQIGVVVHAKTILVDDNWASISSGNIMRRSLYTDLEHGVSFVDEDEVAVATYRMQLWSDHFRHSTPTDFAVTDEALHAWESTWGVAGSAPSRPSWIEPITIPVPEVEFTDDQKTKYDTYQDLDSREEWGGLCPPGLI